MDRRVVAGLVGLVLAALAREAPAQSTPVRDPSSQPAIGMAPIRSLNDSINSVEIPANPNVVPIASGKVPTNPARSGPGAAIPAPPVLNEPVSLTPIDPLHQSISRGFGSGRVASLFRKQGERPVTAASTTPSRFLPGYVNASNSPTALPLTPAPYELPALPQGPRPAPFANQTPEAARHQLDPVVVPSSAEGRPAPTVRETIPNPRPQSPTEAAPAEPRHQLPPTTSANYRPVEPREQPTTSPSTNPTPAVPSGPAELPTVVPIPIDLPSPPPLDPAPTMPPSSASLNLVPPEGLPVLETVVAPSSPPAVANEPPPSGLPTLAAVETPSQPVVTTPQPEPPVAPASLPSEAIVDAQVRQTNHEPTAMELKDSRTKKEIRFITFRAASVGNEIITINELEEAVQIEMSDDPIMQQCRPGSPEFEKRKSIIAQYILQKLIQQRLILQDCKATMARKGGGKGEQAFNDFIESVWKTEELPALHNKYGTTNVHELRIKLKNEGKNYDAIKSAFKNRTMANEFLKGEIRNKVTFDKPELMAYYNTHLNDYVKPSRMTWREIEVNVRRYPDRATARKKADELLKRLLRNESFETIAKTCSNGPTAAQGGVYVDMTPGSYGIPSVNDELNRIPIGQISQVIEAPTSFHIIRVDSRREKGPLRFDEVQDQIKNQVFMENFQKAVNDYLAKLQAKTLVRTMFEQSDEGLVAAGSTPSQAQAPKKDQAVQPAANR